VVETVGPERDHEESGNIGERTQTVDPCMGRGETDHPLGDTEMGSVHVLAQKQGTLLRTGGTKAVQWPAQGMEDAAAQGPKVLQSAVGALAAQARLPSRGLVHLILATPLVVSYYAPLESPLWV